MRGPAPPILRPAYLWEPLAHRRGLEPPEYGCQLLFCYSGPAPTLATPHTPTLSPQRSRKLPEAPMHVAVAGLEVQSCLVCCPKDLQNQLSSPNTFSYLLTPCL